MARALLKYSTDDLGTISVEWNNVTRIFSPATFEVQVSTGHKYYGSLGAAPNGRVTVGADTLSLAEIVAMAPIRQSFVARLDGYVDLGFSFQKAHRTLQLTSGARVVYRGPATESALEFSTFREDRDDAPETSATHHRPHATVPVRRPLERGLRPWSRTERGTGPVRSRDAPRFRRIHLCPVESPQFLDDRWSGGHARAVLLHRLDVPWPGGADWGRLRRLPVRPSQARRVVDKPLYPSLTVQGRVRWQNDARLSYELVKDFMVTFTIFDSFDSKPQSAGASRNDFGTTLAISWTF